MNKFSFENIVTNILLTEGAESRNMKYAKHYLYDNFKYDESEAMSIIGNIKSAIPNVRLAKCKFILGITRLFMQQQLSDGEKLSKINRILRLIASDAHINEYDNNLNNMKADDIINRFSQTMQNNLEQDKSDISNMNITNNNNYQIVRVPDFKTASQYGQYTTWCVTQAEEMYNYYTHHGIGLFYFCLKNGFESVPKEIGVNCPLDEYGLSMIAVSVNSDGSCNTITCRWNHDYKGNDNIMTEKELSNIIGRNFYDVFKPYSPEEIEEKKAKLDDYFIESARSYFEQGGPLEPYNNIMPIYFEREDEDDEDEYYDDDEYNDGMLAGAIFSNQFDDELEEIYESQKFLVLNAKGNVIGDGVSDELPFFNYNTNSFTIMGKNGQVNEYSVDNTPLYPITVDDSRPWADTLRIVNKKDFGMAILQYTRNGRFEFLFNEWFSRINGITKDTFEVWTLNGKSKLIRTNGDVIAEGFVGTRRASEMLFLDYMKPDENYFKLFASNLDGKVELVSNLKFETAFGFYHNGYAVEGIDGKKYWVDYEKKQTYLADEHYFRPIELVDTVKDNYNQIVTENFYNTYRKIL